MSRFRALVSRVTRRAFLLEASLLVSIAGVTAAVSFLVSTRMVVKSADAIRLEDLAGRDAGEAAIWLAANGLRAEIAQFEDNDRAVPFSVVFHEPGAGEDLREGQVVRLVISRGARSVPVPDVRGIYAGQARLILQRNGLAAGEPLRIHDSSATGTVLATAPGPNAPVRGGSVVRMLTSRGPRPRAWVAPDVSWALYESVEELAATMGVPLEIGQRMHSASEPEGVILEQFPAAGLRLVEGSPLRVTVNGEAGRQAQTGGTDLVTLSMKIPKGFGMRELRVRVVRGGWVRTLYDDWVYPGERIRLVAAVLPGDRAIATLDGQDILVRSF